MSTVLVGLSYGRWQLEPETSHICHILLQMLRFKSSEHHPVAYGPSGNPFLPRHRKLKTIELTRGRVALIDDEDFSWLSKWDWHYQKGSPHGHGYAQRQERKADGSRFNIYMHGEILKHHGLWALGKQVDHSNDCGLDNRLENLRPATAAQNQDNQGKRRDNRSGCPGVYWDKQHKKWRTRIKVEGRDIHLGYFDELQDAIDARHAAEIKYFGEFRHDPMNLCPGWLSFCPDCSARFAELLPKGLAVDWDALD